MKLFKILNKEDRIVVGSMVLTMCGVICGALLARPSVFGISTLIVIIILFVGWRITQSERLGWLLLFGFVTGLTELLSDWLHVDHLRSLVYTDYFGFKVLSSPSYMPVGWWLTVVQFGYLAMRLSDYLSQWAVVSIISVLGMSIPPWYEEFAVPAKAWHYTTTSFTLSHTPVWVIFTYGGCMFSISTIALLYKHYSSYRSAVVCGIFAGAGIMFSGVLWFALLG